jgi:hypothetical protein
VQLHPRHRKSGTPRCLELSERGNARIDALARDDRADADESAGLHRIGDTHRAIAEERVDVLAQACADRVGVVDVERRAVAVGELREVMRSDPDVAVAADGRPKRPDRPFDLAG